LIIRYRFRNVLWYDFKNISKTTDKEIIILNIKNLPAAPIELIVYGFFRSKTFYLSIIPESILQNKSFKTSINRINEIDNYSKPIILGGIKPNPSFPKIKLNKSVILIKQSSYTQTDFL
jgi:hypothetical protein